MMAERENMQDVICELDEIDSLLDQGVFALNMCDQFADEAEKQKHENLVKTTEELQNFGEKAAKKLNKQFPQGCSLNLTEFPFPNFTTLVNEQIKLWIVKVTLIVFIISFVLAIPFGFDSLFPYLTIAFFILLMAEGYILNPDRDALNRYKEWKEKASKWKKENAAFEEEVEKKFLEQCQEYDRLFLTYVHECDNKYEQVIQELLLQDSKVDLELLKKQQEQLEKAECIKNELTKKTVISENYFHLAHNISSALKSGRADTLKEALNLAIDDERKDKEEAARRAEAQRQEELMAARAAEERRHNMTMQRAAEEQAQATRAHNEAMEREAKRANDFAMEQQKKQEEAAKQQAKKESEAAWTLCGRCANYSKCAWSVKGKNPNCAAYRPR